MSLTAVQCDERLPGCARCETYGTPCPGYDKGFKFITGKPYRSRRSKPATGNGSSNAKSSRPIKPAAGRTCRAVIQRESPASLTSADLNVLQSLSVLVDDFGQPASANQKHVFHWFGHLPSIYGRSRTLDATIKSFAAHHFGKTLQNEQMIVYARSTYGEALRRLRKSLANSSECLSTYVFCSVVLLCLYEVRVSFLGLMNG